MNQDTERWHSSSDPIMWEVWLWRYTDPDSYDRDYRRAGTVRKNSGGGFSAYLTGGSLLNVYTSLDSARAALRQYAKAHLED